MKSLILLAVLLISSIAQAQTNPAITSWMINTTSIMGRHYVKGNSTPINDNVLANVQTVQYSATSVYVSTKGIPAYITGPFQDGNPSLATDQNAIFKFPLNPVKNTGTPTKTTGGNIGIFINGVALFDYRDGVAWDPATGSICGGPGNPKCTGGMGATFAWNRDAVPAEKAGFDCAKAHPAMGNYHHHQNPSAFSLDLKVISNVCDLYAADGLYAIDSTKHSPLLGFAYDGFPIYGAYAYKNVDGSGGIVRVKTSYSLNTNTTRASGPAINAKVGTQTFFNGYFREDYVYTPTSASTPDYLDDHNGRFCVTPEYPGGIYCYFTTVDENWNSAYPYVVGPTFYGVRTATKETTIKETVTTFTPNAPTLSVSTNSLTIPAAANSTKIFGITTKVAWTVNSNQPWLTASKASGIGNETITLTAQENMTSSTRLATVTVAGVGVASQIITVTQEAKSDDVIKVNPMSIVLSAAANSSSTFTITTIAAWTLTIDSSWLSSSMMSGTGNATITLTAKANSDFNARIAKVSIASAGASTQVVTVTQDPALPILEVSHLVTYVAAAANSTSYFDIESNTSWSINGTKSWLSFNKISGVGNASIVVTATEANPDTVARTAAYSVVTSGKIITISIVQAAKASVGVIEKTALEPSILIYPNPTSDLVAIQINSVNYDNIDVQLYDVLGKLITQTTLYQGTTIAYFDTRSLYNGEYIIRIPSTHGVISKKFILHK